MYCYLFEYGPKNTKLKQQYIGTERVSNFEFKELNVSLLSFIYYCNGLIYFLKVKNERFIVY